MAYPEKKKHFRNTPAVSLKKQKSDKNVWIMEQNIGVIINLK